MLMVGVVHGLARNFGQYACIHPVNKDSLVTGSWQNLFASSVSAKWVAISSEFSVMRVFS